MKTLTLDVSKWRCGGDAKLINRINRTGKGATELLNESGYMCCLGQFALQLGADKEAMRGKDYPASLGKLPLLNRSSQSGGLQNTQFSRKAVSINDNAKTTLIEKIKKLRALCKKHGYKLLVKNSKP